MTAQTITDTDDSNAKEDSATMRELARALWHVTSDKATLADATERRAAWDGERAEMMKAARKLARRLQQKGITLTGSPKSED